MALGVSAAVANAILDAYCRSVAWSEPASFNVKLHIGDPGAAGTSNVAGETTRKAASFSAASAGAITNSGALTWTNVSTTETVSHVSFWDDISAGTFIGSDALNTPRSLTAGDTFEIAAGDLDLSITPVAA
jgi:hypothetical protein